MESNNNIWEERYSQKYQAKFYFNNATGESSWTIPESYNPSSENSKDISKSDIDTSHSSKKQRTSYNNDDELKSEVKVDSYLPPVSGSAADMKVSSRIVVLPKPIIISDLGGNPKQNMWNRKDISVNDYLASIYEAGSIIDNEGILQKFKDITNPLQGRHLYNIIKENRFTRTLEIGFAMGASAVWITQAHKDVNLNGCHIAIDPNQTLQYKNMGRTLVDRCGLSSYMSVMEMTSYRALPKLLEDIIAGKIPKFHVIYIDGWHTFDYTLVDFFYADLILEVNGVIVLDDIKHIPVNKTLEYIKHNYPHYEIVSKTPVYDANDSRVSSQATFIKTALDSREWNYHRDF
jgi:predicted O-methyltransferase YrrM